MKVIIQGIIILIIVYLLIGCTTVNYIEAPLVNPDSTNNGELVNGVRS